MNRKKTKTLNAINYNAGNIRWYQRELLAEIRAMNDEVKQQITNIIRDNPLAEDSALAMDANPVTLVKKALEALARKWVDRFINKALPVSDAVFQRTESSVDRGLMASARREGITINMQWTQAMLEKREAIIAENFHSSVQYPRSISLKLRGWSIAPWLVEATARR